MKKVLFLFFLTFGSSIGIQSCSDNTTGSKAENEEISEYYCPMKCENDKTYSTNESCPVCNMDLIKK